MSNQESAQELHVLVPEPQIDQGVQNYLNLEPSKRAALDSFYRRKYRLVCLTAFVQLLFVALGIWMLVLSSTCFIVKDQIWGGVYLIFTILSYLNIYFSRSLIADCIYTKMVQKLYRDTGLAIMSSCCDCLFFDDCIDCCFHKCRFCSN